MGFVTGNVTAETRETRSSKHCFVVSISDMSARILKASSYTLESTLPMVRWMLEECEEGQCSEKLKRSRERWVNGGSLD